ncbi:MAG: HDOD domain-containing protein [Pseudomonadota bacterium]
MTDTNHHSSARAGTHSALSAEASIRRLRNLPPLPRTSQALLQMLSDPDLDMLTLAETIEQTPSLAARILGVANSAFFAHAAAVRDVPDAIIRVLGLHLVRDLSISFALSQPFEINDCAHFDPKRYWIAAMESAVLAQLIASRTAALEGPKPAEAYLSGLLHNLGLLALIHIAPQAMNQVFARIQSEPDLNLIQEERLAVGLDHSAAGAALASAWQLPPLLAVAMGAVVEDPPFHQEQTLLLILSQCSRIRQHLAADAIAADAADLHEGWQSLGIASDVMPAVIAQFRDRSDEIGELAAVFLGAGR